MVPSAGEKTCSSLLTIDLEGFLKKYNTKRKVMKLKKRKL
jgi:hypothetical protein